MFAKQAEKYEAIYYYPSHVSQTQIDVEMSNKTPASGDR